MKSVFSSGISCVPPGDVNVPWPRPCADEAAARDRVRRLDDLVAGPLRVGPRVEPVHDPRLDARDDGVRSGRARHEECEPRRGVERPVGGHVQHPEEDPEVEERRAEVVRLDEHGHGCAPDHEQWAEVLDPPASRAPRASPVSSRRGRRSGTASRVRPAGTATGRSPPQPRAVDRAADHRERGEDEQHDGAQPEEVLVRLKHAVVPTGVRGACPRRPRLRPRPRGPGGRRRSARAGRSP